MAHRDAEHSGSMIGDGAAPTSDDSDKPARAVIARFGGIRPMAAKLGVAVTTVQGWKERGVIPAARHAQVLEAAREHGIALSETALAPSRQATPAVMIPAPPSQAESPTPTEAVAPPAPEPAPEPAQAPAEILGEILGGPLRAETAESPPGAVAGGAVITQTDLDSRIRVGLLLPLSGAQARLGNASLNAAQIETGRASGRERV